MPFPSALTTTQLDTIRMGGFYADYYMLLWDAPIVFEAQINQATFTDSFASITFDNVTVGAYTDIKSDFRVYVSASKGVTGILAATHTFRARADGSYVVATATILNINETSAALVNNTYIIVVKDVPIAAKVPRAISGTTPATNSHKRDYAVAHRRLLPLVYNLSSYYVGVLGSDGVFDLALAPNALLVDNDASSVTTWLWEIDGMAFQSGSSSTQNITARATAPGKYMPRVTITDNNANKGYFTFKLWVVPADKNSELYLAFDAPTITGDTTNGWTCDVSANATSNLDVYTRIDRLSDLSDCAIWFDSNFPAITSEIVFAGRIQKETVNNSFDATGNLLLSTSFSIEGFAGQTAKIISRRMAIVDDSTPSVFGEIEDVTPHRAVCYYLTEHTTLPNVASIVFDATGEVFRFPRFGTGDSSALESVNDLLFTINASMMFAPTGEIEISRKAWMVSSAARNSLTTIANFTTADMQTNASGGLLFSISRDYQNTVGREMGGGAYYTSATGNVQVLKALTPAVAQAEGSEMATTNRQILSMNSSIASANTELGQRTADDRAARQPQTILSVTMPASYIQAVIPHESKWYTWTIAATDNNAGLAYTTADRWTCQSVSISYNPTFGLPMLVAVFKLETQGVGFKTVVLTPPIGDVQFFNPVLPIAPTYAAMPELDTLYLPDPTTVSAGDTPPFSKDDVEKVSKPSDPYHSGGGAGGSFGFGERMGTRASLIIVWDASTLWAVKNVRTTPSFTDETPAVTGSLTHAKLDKLGTTCWAICNDGTNSQLWRNKPFPEVWSNYDLADDTYQMIAPTGQLDKMYVYDSGDGAAGTLYDFTIDAQTWIVGNYPAGGQAVYVAASYWRYVDYTYSSFKLRACNIRKTFASATVTSIQCEFNYTDGYREIPGYNMALTFAVSGVAVKVLGNTELADGNQKITWEGSQVGTDVQVFITSDMYTNVSTRTGNVQILNVTLDASYVKTRYSSDSGVSFASAEVVGVSPTGGTEAGVATILSATVDNIIASAQERIYIASAGGAYSAEIDGATAGTYAAAIVSLSSGDGDYVYGTASSVGGDSLFKVISGTNTAITPSDGADGIVVGALGLAVDSRYPERILGLFTFGATVKLAYSPDSGVTWQFNTQISNDAVCIDVKSRNGQTEVYVADAATLWVGSWEGTAASTLIMQAKVTPSAALLGVDVL